MNVHDGHRQRLKDQFLAHGLDAMGDHQALELLLFFANPRGDMNPVAHRLLERFKSFHGVLDAPPEQLMKVQGVGPNTATLLKLLPPLFRRYQLRRGDEDLILNSVEAIRQIVLPLFTGFTEEAVFLLSLDAKCKVLDISPLGKGNVNAVTVDPRKVVHLALNCNASAAVLTHNHTSGVALPSQEDLITTKTVAAALGAVGVRLLDHIVVSDNDFVSFSQSQSLRSYLE